MKRISKFLGTGIVLCLCSLGIRAQNLLNVAGTSAGYSGDGGLAINAQLNHARGVCKDAAGNTYIVDTENHCIRRKDAVTGIITIFAGTTVPGYSGDGGPAINAQFSFPFDICIDKWGNMYIFDTYNYRIRKIDAITGIITTVAGTGVYGFSGDGGLAINAKISHPTGGCVDTLGNVYFADAYNHRIRKIDAITRIITTIAGTGTPGYSGDGGPAINAQFNYPWDVAVDSFGNLYVADYHNNAIRKITLATDSVITVGGKGTAGYSGDNGPAINAQLNAPLGVDVDGYGNIYIADYDNNRIRKIIAATGTIITIAGTGVAGSLGDGGLATQAQLNHPMGPYVDVVGNVYIADYMNSRIREIVATPVPVKLLTFDVMIRGNGADITWSTASQFNNNYFEVERSSDGVSWKSIERVAGCGNCSTVMYYQTTDQHPLSGVSQYRLRQVDYDGTSTLSKIVTVKINTSTITVSHTTNDTYRISGLVSGMSIALYNMQGSLVARKVVTSSSYDIDMSQYPKGCYVIHVVSKEMNFSTQIMR